MPTPALFARTVFADVEWGLGRNYMVSLSHYSGIGFERAASLANNSPALYFSSHPPFFVGFAGLLPAQFRPGFSGSGMDRCQATRVGAPAVCSGQANDLMHADSGLWETPAPGEHFLYTTASAYQGLTCAAILAQTLGE